METPNAPNQITIEMRHRTLLILWFAMCMSVLMLLVVAQFIPVHIKIRQSSCADCLSDNSRLSLILNSLAIVPTGVSFLLKRLILGQAVARQRLDLVQTAYILAFALCELSALLGLVDHFINDGPFYYVGFIFAGLGLLLHFPRKQHLLDASQQQF